MVNFHFFQYSFILAIAGTWKTVDFICLPFLLVLGAFDLTFLGFLDNLLYENNDSFVSSFQNFIYTLLFTLVSLH